MNRPDPYISERAARFTRDRERALAHLRGAAASIECALQIVAASTGERELEPGTWPGWRDAAEKARTAAEAAHTAAARDCTR